jgi:hypothetical protein
MQLVQNGAKRPGKSDGLIGLLFVCGKMESHLFVVKEVWRTENVCFLAG